MICDGGGVAAVRFLDTLFGLDVMRVIQTTGLLRRDTRGGARHPENM